MKFIEKLGFKSKDEISQNEPEDSLNELKVPDEIYNWKIVLIAITAAFCACIIGYDSAFIAGTIALPSFQQEFGMDTMSEEASTAVHAKVVSVFQAGAFFGCLIFYPISEKLGRKIGMIISGFLLTFGSAISLYSSGAHGLAAIYAGRVLTGVGIGGCSSIVPIFISESSPVKIRGKLVGIFEICWQMGAVVAFFLNYGVAEHIPVSRKQWLIPFSIQLVPSGMFWIGTFFVPESPRFLINVGKIDQAAKNLAYIRNLPLDHEYSKFEMTMLIHDIEDRKLKLGPGFFAPMIKVFTTKKLLYRLLLSTSLFPMQNGSGINAINYYSPTIFKSLGVTGSSAALLSTGIFGLIKGFASLVWIFFVVERLGRRQALIIASVPCSICMWYIGAYVKIRNPAEKLAMGITSMDNGGRAAQAMLYIWTLFYGMSWNGTPWVINSEIFAQDVRTFVQSINSCSNWFWAFVFGYWTGEAFAAMGYGFYFLFASCLIVFPIVIYLFYPETKGVPLEAMDYLFEVPAWKARTYALGKIEQENQMLRRGSIVNASIDKFDDVNEENIEIENKS